MRADKYSDEAFRRKEESERIQTDLELLKWALGGVRALESFPKSNLKEKILADLRSFLDESPSYSELSSQVLTKNAEIQQLQDKIRSLKARIIALKYDCPEISTTPDSNEDPDRNHHSHSESNSQTSKSGRWGCIIVILGLIVLKVIYSLLT